jgi:RNA polymerase sigma-70 factor (ECF subfamily)
VTPNSVTRSEELAGSRVKRTVGAVADQREARLAERAGAGDPDAFWSLVEPYERGLRAVAYRVLGNRDLMDDALQEAYLKAFRALPSFRGDARVASWLYRIVYNSCLDQLRRARLRRHAPLEATGERSDPGPDPAEVATRRHDLAAALASLPPDMRAAVLLVDAEGMDYREAAEILGISRGTVASRLNRARAHLRRALGDGTEGVKGR